MVNIRFLSNCYFAFVLPLTEKKFDLQVNSLGRDYLLLTLWHQSPHEVDRNAVSFSLLITENTFWHKPLKYNRPMTSQSMHLNHF